MLVVNCGEMIEMREYGAALLTDAVELLIARNGLSGSLVKPRIPCTVGVN